MQFGTYRIRENASTPGRVARARLLDLGDRVARDPRRVVVGAHDVDAVDAHAPAIVPRGPRIAARVVPPV